MIKETLIKALSDFTLKFLCMVRNHLTRIATSYLRSVMTKLCITIFMKSDSVIESAFPQSEIITFDTQSLIPLDGAFS